MFCPNHFLNMSHNRCSEFWKILTFFLVIQRALESYWQTANLLLLSHFLHIAPFQNASRSKCLDLSIPEQWFFRCWRNVSMFECELAILRMICVCRFVCQWRCVYLSVHLCCVAVCVCLSVCLSVCVSGYPLFFLVLAFFFKLVLIVEK